MRGGKISRRILRVLENAQMAGRGVLSAFRDIKFDIAFVVAFVFFGTLMNLLASGTAAFGLLRVSGGMFLQAVWSAFLGIFGVGRSFWDWALFFVIALLQGILIGGIIVVWQDRKMKVSEGAASQTGIAAGLAILGSGCPTCGTTLLAPVVGSLFGSSALAMAGAISGILMGGSILLAFWTAYKLGLELYVIMEGRKLKKGKEK